jgi:glucose/arabinose dehydrogenase
MKITSHIPHRSIGGLAALCIATLLGSITTAHGDEYQTRVVASGLHRPTGIAIRGNNTIYFTEIPTPAVGGGSNAVKQLELRWNQVTTLHVGEPEPTNIALDRDGNIYWTCKSAGVILEQDEDGVNSVFLRGLTKPTGIAVDRDDHVYFTQLPTPGVPGSAGGTNSVSVSDGRTTEVLHMGEPEPSDIAVAKNGDLYWTCKSAGVILEQTAKDGVTRVLASGLNKPVGITIDNERKNLYFTEVPTPGVSGRNGGSNKVWEFDLKKKTKTLVNAGDPEPTDVTVAKNGKLYWTCTSAGVIVEASLVRGKK